MTKIISALFISLLTFQISFAATNRYVSSVNGSTGGAGTQGNPYKNLSQLTTLAAGDTIFLEAGSLFREQLNLFAGGNQTSALVITSYGNGAKPIISGADTVSNWTQNGNKFYATQTGSVKNFFSNNIEQIIARTPDEGTYYELDSAQTTYLKDGQLTEPNNCWNGAKVCIHTAQWCWEKVSVSNNVNGKVTYSSPITLAATNRFGYFFYDKDSCLNAQREWFYDSVNSRIYFIPQSGNPNSLHCEVSTRTNGIQFSNTASYVTIKNIRFEKQANAGVVMGSQSKGVQIINCEFFGQYNHGVQTRGKYHLIQYCNFNEVDAHGVDINAGGNTEVSYCNFKNIGQFRNSGIGGQTNLTAIAINLTDSCHIHHNVIDSTGYCGISADGAYNIIERNMASHCMLLNNDGAPFKAWGPTSQHEIFRNNIAFNTVGNTAGTFNGTFQTPGIYFDFWVNNCTIENNTVYGVSQKGIFQNSSSTDNKILGNVVFGSDVSLDLNGTPLAGDTLNRIEIKRNTLCTSSASQSCFRQVDTYNPSIFAQGVIDSNYYFQPYDTNHVVFRPGNAPQNISLSAWRTFCAQDAHTKNAFLNYNTLSYYPELFINATDNDSLFHLTNSDLVDLKEQTVCDTFTLAPYTSRVLVHTGDVCNPFSSVSEINSEIQFSVFPNPAHDNLSVICNEVLVGEELNVVDLSGRKISSQIIADNILEINVSTLAAGVYFIRVKNEVKKFVKQ